MGTWPKIVASSEIKGRTGEGATSTSKELLTSEQFSMREPIQSAPKLINKSLPPSLKLKEQDVEMTGEQEISPKTKPGVNNLLLTSEQITGEHLIKQVSSPTIKTGEQAIAHPIKRQVGRTVLTSEQSAKIIPITSRKKSKGKTQKPKKKRDLYDVLTSEQLVSEQHAKNLQTLLPKSGSGWWEVRPEGRGFTIKFRWRNPKQQTQTFPRISGEQFRLLKEYGNDRARSLIYDRIAGYLEDCLFDPIKRDKARLAATRIGIDLDNDKNALAANY